MAFRVTVAVIVGDTDDDTYIDISRTDTVMPPPGTPDAAGQVALTTVTMQRLFDGVRGDAEERMREFERGMTADD
jgi:hypothetical protein